MRIYFNEKYYLCYIARAHEPPEITARNFPRVRLQRGPWPAPSRIHVATSETDTAGLARYIRRVSSCSARARCTPSHRTLIPRGVRDGVRASAIREHSNVFRPATCVVFGTGADIGETTSRPFIPQWRLNTSERAAAFPRYCAREKLADVRWMRNRVVACQCFPNWLLSSPRQAEVGYFVPLPRARASGRRTEGRNSKNLISEEGLKVSPLRLITRIIMCAQVQLNNIELR